MKKFTLRPLTLIFLFGFLFVALASVASAQDLSNATATQDESILQTIWNGGVLMRLIWIALLATSITMVSLIIQSFVMLRLDRLVPPQVHEVLANAVAAGNYQEAWETCHANNHYIANVLKAGLVRIGRGKEAVEDAVADVSLQQAMQLRIHNSYLSVIGVIAPMLGLLGTVVGMIQAFHVLGAQGIQEPRGLATSISDVLTATAAGLFIAIPAFIAYYIFRNHAHSIVVAADDCVNQLLIDIPYEELQGVKIGETFSAGGTSSHGGETTHRRVSLTLTTNCPVCNGAVSPGTSPCPHCGSTLEWT